MTDVWTRGSMLDRQPRLPLEGHGSCMSVNGMEETKGFPLTPCGVHATGSGTAGLQNALLSLPLCVQLLTVYLLIILIMGTFLSSAADLWLFHFN